MVGTKRVAKVLCVAGARPNFPKIAPIVRALGESEQYTPVLLHTGQHYDERLSKVFFDDLEIPHPDLDLGVGSGSHASQTAEIMRRFEEVLDREQPEAVLVVGDVNSTVACALVTSKYRLAKEFHCRDGGQRRRPLLIHVEAGLRSFDEDMPEEINRRVTDALSDLLLVSDPAVLENLRKEGIPPDRVRYVGNVMIDSLLRAKSRAMKSRILDELGLQPNGYGLLTLHRPSNVDDADQLRHLIAVLTEIATDQPIVFPVHPRTASRLAELNIELSPPHWRTCEPLGYLDFLRLMVDARVVLSDSGGIQEETTVLGVRCLTLRDNTERPVTLTEGTNTLAGTRRETILPAFRRAIGTPPSGRVPHLWDGTAADRVRAALDQLFR